MTFNDEIYAAICAIWPCTNVRAFSQALGRSTGYWNSIKSQNLQLSTGALMNLLSTLETKIITAKHEVMKRQMTELQHKIAQELARRFVDQVEADEQVLEELQQILQANSRLQFNSSIPLPIVITSNDTFSGFR